MGENRIGFSYKYRIIACQYTRFAICTLQCKISVHHLSCWINSVVMNCFFPENRKRIVWQPAVLENQIRNWQIVEKVGPILTLFCTHIVIYTKTFSNGWQVLSLERNEGNWKGVSKEMEVLVTFHCLLVKALQDDIVVLHLC